MKSKSNDKKELKTAKVTYKKDIKQGIPVHGVYGVAVLFVCASILFANYVVYFGTDGLTTKLLLVPSTIFVAAFLVYKAIK